MTNNKNKIIFCTVVLAFIFSGMITDAIPKSNKYLNSIISSINKNDFITAHGQYGGYDPMIVTVAVEQNTQNHLPNITGTCTVGGVMTFKVKKGATGVLSETLTKTCDVSPYLINPTILLPDGKYRVDVKIAAPSGGGR
jgi:hypothetical protein